MRWTVDHAWARRFLAATDFIEDVRKPIEPGDHPLRRERFRQGWHDAKERAYTSATLRRLTWQNLGHRCGLRFGDTIESDRAFEAFRAVYEADGPVVRRAAWIVCVDLAEFDLFGYLATGATMLSWPMQAEHPSMTRGDRVFLWALPEHPKGRSGVVAIATVASSDALASTGDVATRFWRRSGDRSGFRVGLSIVEAVSDLATQRMIRRQWLEGDPVCSGLAVVRGANAACEWVAPPSATRLERLWSRADKPWSDAEAIAALVTWLDVRGGRIPKKSDSPVARLALLTGRSISAAYGKVQDCRATDPDHSGGLHDTKQIRSLWDEFSPPGTQVIDEAVLRAEFERLWKDAPVQPESPINALAGAITLRPYRRSNETLEPRPRTSAEYDPDAVGRGYRSHARLQNALHDHLVTQHIKPGGPEPGGPIFDLGWWFRGVFYVAEVKSLTLANAEKQLRLGLGQVLHYRHLLLDRAPTVIAVLVVEYDPGPTWSGLCDDLGIRLVWPDGWSGVLAAV